MTTENKPTAPLSAEWLETHRPEFEAWARSNSMLVIRKAPGEEYAYPLAKASWAAWRAALITQARAALLTGNLKRYSIDCDGLPFEDVEGPWIAHSDMAAAQQAPQASVEDARDTARLDWLDEVNRETNAHYGTQYGWKFDLNHNRAALMDYHWPPHTIRQAIDAAMSATQEGK